MQENSFVKRNHSLLGSALALTLLGFSGVASAAPKASTSHADEATSAPAAASGVVNVNSATEAELVRLPGVGPSRAKAILEMRARIKRFDKLEDLMRVKGIGRATFRNLRPLLTLDGPTTLLNKPEHVRAKEAKPATP